MAKGGYNKPIQNPVLTKKIVVSNKGIKTWFSINYKYVILLIIIAIIVYANTLKNGFVYDDISAISKNTIVTKGISAIPEILSTPYRKGFIAYSNDLYRPLSLVTFAVEYEFFGNNPAPFHFFNIIFFAGCVILLFLFLDQFFERKRTAVAFIASLLFAIHPIHTEVVANIKGRDELLCFFFAFLSLNVFLLYQETARSRLLFAGALCFFLSLLSKETTITFLAVIPLIFFFYRNENRKYSINIALSATFAAIIFLTIRYSVLNYYHANYLSNISMIDNALAKHGLPYESRMATAILIAGYYLKLLFVPYPLICDYAYNTIPYVDFSDIGVLLSLAVYLFLIIYSIRRFIKNNRDAYAFGILFFLITLSLFSNIPFLIGTNMGERLLFLPSVGFCLIIALLLEGAFRDRVEPGIIILKNKKLLALLIPVSIVFMVITVNRNREWLNNYTLYTSDIKKAPGNSRLYFNLASELENMYAKNEKDSVKRRNIRNEIIDNLRKSLAIYPHFSEAECDLGYAFLNNSQYDSAEVHEKKAIAINPGNLTAVDNLAEISVLENNTNEIIEFCRKSIALNPGNGNVQTQIGKAFFSNSQYDSSETHEKRAIEINPKNTDAIYTLAGAYFGKKKYDKAIELCKNAIMIDPRLINSYINLSACYFKLGKYDSVIYYSNRYRRLGRTTN